MIAASIARLSSSYSFFVGEVVVEVPSSSASALSSSSSTSFNDGALSFGSVSLPSTLLALALPLLSVSMHNMDCDTVHRSQNCLLVMSEQLWKPKYSRWFIDGSAGTDNSGKGRFSLL